MHVTLKTLDQILGTADWEKLPDVGDVICLRSEDGLAIEARRVDKIEDAQSGDKIVHLGGPRPTFSFAR